MTAYDVAVVGAGAAGASAAMQARELGLSVVLIDEQRAAGGQVYRAPATSHADDRGPGGRLRRALDASSIDRRLGSRVWMIEPQFCLHLYSDDGLETISAKTLILATGAQERFAPVDGWTLPGVVGLAAATVLLKSEGVLPGQRVVVAGRGPLLLLVAALVVKKGGHVVAVLDEASRQDWLGTAPSALARPDLLLQGATWLATLLARRTPIHSRTRVQRMLGDKSVRAVTFASASGRETTLECDAVCYGHGLVPSTDATRLLGANHVWSSDARHWRVDVDDKGRTSVDNLFVCGDGASIMGAAAAPLRGKLAACAAAEALGVLSAKAFRDRTKRLTAKLEKAARFGLSMTRMTDRAFDITALAGPDSVICRCESVTRSTIEAACDSGAKTLDGVKSLTRCGMGPCGGRYCGEAVAAIVARRCHLSPQDVGQPSVRPPLRPLPLKDVVGDFRYEDIPMPELAPL